MAHTHVMFLRDPLATTISLDRQIRFRRAATRRRLISGSKVPPTDLPSTTVRSIDWSADTDLVLAQPRATCVA